MDIITEKAQLELLGEITKELLNIPITFPSLVGGNNEHEICGHKVFFYHHTPGNYYCYVYTKFGGVCLINTGIWATSCTSHDPIFFKTVADFLACFRKMSVEEETW